MKKKRLVLKPFVIPSLLFTVASLALVITVVSTQPSIKEKYEYVSGVILDEYVPVINQVSSNEIIKPYINEKVTIGKNYYDYTLENQENAIVYYEGSYMQNTGVDYVNDEAFDVISILDGEVLEVTENELLGKTLTVKHSEDIISTYQGLSEINVTKGEIITQGETIGKSGLSEINKDLGNHLHFELSIKGELVNPSSYIGKTIDQVN